MKKPSADQPTEKTPTGFVIPVRSREGVLSDFRKVVAPPKAQTGQRKKPKPAS
jgi:hypothetical protein